uniref:Uncharacterized protein n=1 Tax=Onchocerca volvulus TaxID=6282 RepID=A0A8R1XUX8_ONCVO
MKKPEDQYRISRSLALFIYHYDDLRYFLTLKSHKLFQHHASDRKQRLNKHLNVIKIKRRSECEA